MRWDGVQRSRQIAVVGGLEFPTGDTDQKGLGFRIGSGSFDPFVGLGWSEGWQYWDFNASAFYQLNTEGTRDIERGDILVLGTEVDYYPIRKAFPGPEMFVGLQVFWEHEFRERVNGDPVRDSGGDRIFLGPLVGYSPRPDLVLDLALFLPVLQDLNGDQLEDSWILSAGVRYRF